MRIQSTAAFLVLLGSASLHGVNANKQGLRRQQRKLATSECTIMVAESLFLPGHEDDQDASIACVMDPADMDGQANMIIELEVDRDQKAELVGMVERGEVVPAWDGLDITGAEITTATEGGSQKLKLKFAQGQSMMEKVKKKTKRKNGPNVNGLEETGRRHLATTNTIGQKDMLLVKVYDVNGLTFPDSAVEMR